MFLYVGLKFCIYYPQKFLIRKIQKNKITKKKKSENQENMGTHISQFVLTENNLHYVTFYIFHNR